MGTFTTHENAQLSYKVRSLDSNKKGGLHEKILSLTFVFLVFLAAVSCSAPKKRSTIIATVTPNASDISEADAYSKISGKFTGSADGLFGEVTVTIIVENGVVTSCTATGDDEIPSMGGRAVSDLPSAILKKKSVQVDGVSGATQTSNAVILAATNAFLAAGLDPYHFQ